jgi:hypothetical protein
LREEADGGRAVIGLVEESMVERGMLIRLDERKVGVALQREVLGPFGFATLPAT